MRICLQNLCERERANVLVEVVLRLYSTLSWEGGVEVGG
jgi:hypothetical protein